MHLLKIIHILWFDIELHISHVFILEYKSNCCACKERENDLLLAENGDLNEDRWPITEVGLSITYISDQLFHVI